MSITASQRLARHVVNLGGAPLDAATIAAAKIWILDTFGVGVAGATAEGQDRLRHAAGGWGSGEECVVWGTNLRLPAPSAALLNATQVHCQEFDCLHEGAVVHAMATLLPAVMAFAERRGGISGEAMLRAVVAGLDVSAGIGLASSGAFRFFRPATAGGFGAAAASAFLAGLDADGIAHALGIQYAQTSGTMQAHAEASAVLPMQIGANARAALTSADLAAAGMTGPRDVLEGRYGYFPLFEGTWDIERLWAALAGGPLARDFSHKPYAAGRATHGGIEGILTLRAAHGIVPEAVEHVRIIGPKLINRLVNRPVLPAPNSYYARLCMPFMGAKALQHGEIDIAHCRGAALTDPVTHALAARIRMEEDDNPDANALAPQRVVIRLRDGREYDWHCTEMLANPARKLTHAQHLAKFRRCWEFAEAPLGAARAEALIALVERLETVADIREISALLRA